MGKIVYNGREYLSAGTASTMQGATSTTDGVSGLVPQPLITDRDKVLKGDGTWGDTSEVEANPSGTATDTLQKVDIDGVIYDIQGGSGGGGSNLILDASIYSTDEKIVGIWIDGKPLYQKTINCGALPLNAQKNIDLNVNIDNCISCEGYAISAQYGYVIYFNDAVPNSARDNVRVYITVNDDKLHIQTATNDVSIYNNSYVTIKYTKTTDAAGSGGYQAWGFSPIIYSTEEREVGVWHDNKPLYEKGIIITGLGSSQGYTDFPLNISNAEIKTVEGCYWLPNGITRQFGNYLITTTGTADNGYAVQAQAVNNNTVRITYCAGRSTLTGFIRVRYTKTTDTPGSGSYNTLGVPNVHYSTDEQVIGTWIDGKPLYQKTVYVANPTINTSLVSIPNAISPNVDTTVEIIGTIDRDLASYGTNGCISYDINNTEASNVYNYVRYDKYNDTLMYKCKFDTNTAKNLIVTIKYTKTTD